VVFEGGFAVGGFDLGGCGVFWDAEDGVGVDGCGSVVDGDVFFVVAGRNDRGFVFLLTVWYLLFSGYVCGSV